MVDTTSLTTRGGSNSERRSNGRYHSIRITVNGGLLFRLNYRAINRTVFLPKLKCDVLTGSPVEIPSWTLTTLLYTVRSRCAPQVKLLPACVARRKPSEGTSRLVGCPTSSWAVAPSARDTCSPIGISTPSFALRHGWHHVSLQSPALAILAVRLPMARSSLSRLNQGLDQAGS